MKSRYRSTWLRSTERWRSSARMGARLMVGFNRRFDPSHAAVRAAVADGSVGAPHLVRITSRDPEPPPMSYARVSGGIFLDMTVHDFDMARYVVGSEVVEVTAAGAVRIEPELEEIGDVDTAVITLRHENDCLTVIDNSRRATYGYDQRVEVLGAKGLAGSDNPLQHGVHPGRQRDPPGDAAVLFHRALPAFLLPPMEGVCGCLQGSVSRPRRLATTAERRWSSGWRPSARWWSAGRCEWRRWRAPEGQRLAVAPGRSGRKPIWAGPESSPRPASVGRREVVDAPVDALAAGHREVTTFARV